MSSAAGLPEWMWLSARIELAESAGRAAERAGLMERMKRSLGTPWEPQGSPIYDLLSGGGVNDLTGRLKELLEHRERGGAGC